MKLLLDGGDSSYLLLLIILSLLYKTVLSVISTVSGDWENNFNPNDDPYTIRRPPRSDDGGISGPFPGFSFQKEIDRDEENLDDSERKKPERPKEERIPPLTSVILTRNQPRAILLTQSIQKLYSKVQMEVKFWATEGVELAVCGKARQKLKNCRLIDIQKNNRAGIFIYRTVTGPKQLRIALIARKKTLNENGILVFVSFSANITSRKNNTKHFNLKPASMIRKDIEKFYPNFDSIFHSRRIKTRRATGVRKNNHICNVVPCDFEKDMCKYKHTEHFLKWDMAKDKINENMYLSHKFFERDAVGVDSSVYKRSVNNSLTFKYFCSADDQIISVCFHNTTGIVPGLCHRIMTRKGGEKSATGVWHTEAVPVPHDSIRFTLFAVFNAKIIYDKQSLISGEVRIDDIQVVGCSS